MKMRTLTSTKSKKLLAVAEAVNRVCESTYKVDTIYQPAYACDRERLVVIAGPVKEKMPSIYARTLRSYNKSVTSNVAFIVLGDHAKSEQALDKYISMVREAGANVIEDVFYVKPSIFGGASDVDISDAEKWIKSVLLQLS